MKEEVFDKIKAATEILETMPINNEKNIERYNEKIQELKNEYGNIKNKIVEEIQSRFKKKIDGKTKEETEYLKKELENYEYIMEIVNTIPSPYEKSNLDREIYKLGKYYKENLETVNNQILICITILRNLGVNISPQSFTISEYAKEYMEVFFSGMKLGDINSEEIKNKFEEIYWKCPDLITHIEINIKSIYRNNINIVNRFYAQKKQEILVKYKIKEEEIEEQYLVTKKQLDTLELMQRNTILNLFLSGTLKVKDYTHDKIESYYEKILDREALDTIKNNPQKLEEYDNTILKLKNSIYEYKKFMEYKFILEAVISKYKEKENYKILCKEDRKKIDSKESKIKKLNKKRTWGKKKNKNPEINTIINALKSDYKTFEKNKFYRQIADMVTSTTTIYDILNLASCFYTFLVDCIIEQDREIEPIAIDKKVDDLIEFVKSPYITIINNIYIEENKDIALMIKDRYKLWDFKIEKEDLEKENIDTLLDILEKIRINYAMKKNGLEINEISNLCEYKKIIKDNNK